MNIDNLTVEEKQTLITLLQKSLEEKPKKQRGRPRKTAVPIEEGPSKGGQKPPNIATKRPNKPSGSGPIKRKAGKKKTSGQEIVSQKENEKGLPCRIESFEIYERPNLFQEIVFDDSETIELERAAKEDKLAQAKRKKNKVLKRTTTRVTTVNDVVCSRCDSIYDGVSAKLCYKDNNKYIFVCPDCEVKR